MRTLTLFLALAVGWTTALLAQESTPTPPAVDEPPAVESPPAAEAPPPAVDEVAPAPAAPADQNGTATFGDPENNPPEEPPAAVPAPAGESGTTAAPAGNVPEVYTIQSGDTLWDLCDKFMGNPWYWPKLWSLNQYIENPHLIYPGNKIQFFLGSESAPPKLDIVGSGAKPAKAIPESPKVGEAQETAPPPEAPAAAATPAPSFGNPGFLAYSANESMTVKLKNVSFISEKEMKDSGVISHSGDPKLNLVAGDRLYVQFKDPSKVNVGDQFHVFQKIKKVKSPGKWFGSLGTMVQLKAVVKVVEIHKNTIEGMITDNTDSVMRGDRLVPYVSPYRTVQPHESDKRIEGQIVESEDLKFLISNNDYVYLNLGKNQGVDDGLKMVAVRRGDGLGGDDNKLPRVVVGRMIVVQAKDNSSTAYVTDLKDSLSIGDLVVTKAN